MFRSLHLLALAAVVSVLAGCATPRYETTYRYEPPTGVEAQSCIKGCEATLNTCRADCQAAWQSCTERIEPQVDERYAQALKAYADELRLYRLALDRYEWDMWVGWGHGHSGLWYSPWPYHPWSGHWPGYFPYPGPPEDPPTREAVRTKLRKAQCQDDCGCQVKYDACFQGCGGRVVTETRCVANCPAGK